eukprot:COSAG05_NODE_8288_length_718_cov_0.767367_1_plen_80_part_00
MEMEEKKKEEGKEAEKKEKSTGTGKQNSSSTAQRPAQRVAGTHIKHKPKQMQMMRPSRARTGSENCLVKHFTKIFQKYP